jgi:hypothetical protein
LECGDKSPLFNDATRRVEPKRRHAGALQNHYFSAPLHLCVFALILLTGVNIIDASRAGNLPALWPELC